DANLGSALGIPHAVQNGIVPIAKQIALIEERTGATVDNYGKAFKLNPDVKDVSERFGYYHNCVNVIVLGAIQMGGGGCACPASTFARALVTDLILYKNQHLIIDMEAGVEHLGRATTQGVDVMLIVAEPGQRAVDCANSVVKMANEIGIKRFLCVGNKVQSAEDEAFLRNALPNHEFAAMLPYDNQIRQADRDGVSVLDTGNKALQNAACSILERLC
ncbi:MAG: carbon monoxide dehydrogenase, partial [Clostridia bacterium]|nr:carbon monoxide dehydrogenase [Clostridia bacterium]